MKIKIGDKYSSDYNLMVKGYPGLPTPQERLEYLESDGKDGEIIYHTGFYEDSQFTIEFYIAKDETNNKETYTKASEWFYASIGENLYLVEDPIFVGYTMLPTKEDYRRRYLKESSVVGYGTVDTAVVDDEDLTIEKADAAYERYKEIYAAGLAQSDGSTTGYYEIKNVEVGNFEHQIFKNGSFSVTFTLGLPSYWIKPSESTYVKVIKSSSYVYDGNPDTVDVYPESCEVTNEIDGTWSLNATIPSTAENAEGISWLVKRGACMYVKTWQTNYQVYRVTDYTQHETYIEVNGEPYWYEAKNIIIGSTFENSGTSSPKGYMLNVSGDVTYKDSGIINTMKNNLYSMTTAENTLDVSCSSSIAFSDPKRLLRVDMADNFYDWLLSLEGDSEDINCMSVLQALRETITSSTDYTYEYVFDNKTVTIAKGVNSDNSVIYQFDLDNGSITRDGVTISVDWTNVVDTVYPVGHNYGDGVLCALVQCHNLYDTKNYIESSIVYDTTGGGDKRYYAINQRGLDGAFGAGVSYGIGYGHKVRLECDDIYYWPDAVALSESFDVVENDSDIKNPRTYSPSRSYVNLYPDLFSHCAGDYDDGTMYTSLSSYQSALRKRARAYWLANRNPEVSIDVDLSVYGKFNQYDAKSYNAIKLGNTVKITHSVLGLDMTGRITAITWDCCTNKPSQITIGNKKINHYKF